MKHILYFITRVLFYFYSFELQIEKPAKRKSLTRVPTSFKVHGSRWWTLILGGFTLLAMLAGLSLLISNVESPTKYEVLSYTIISIIIISAFVNQMLLKGEIEVQNNIIEFNYRSIFGLHVRTEDISGYNCIWVQKMRTRLQHVDRGRPYVKILLKHSSNRFRSIQLYEGPQNETKSQFYANLFGLPIKKSLITIRGKFV